MDSLEPKKLAIFRIWQILKEESDANHPLMQEDIRQKLIDKYGVDVKRKAIGNSISLLKEAGVEIESVRGGSYLAVRDFEDAELHMLIDGVLSSRYIAANHSEDLIKRIAGLSNKYFKAGTKNVYSVNDWGKTDNQELFYNIDVIDRAIEKGVQVKYDYNKYGADKKLHKTSTQEITPYRMILHNQRYYLMGYSEYWSNVVFHRLDHVTNISIQNKPAYPLSKIPGYENGINYKELATGKPYMFSDKSENVVFNAEAWMVDSIIDWFGRDVKIVKLSDDTVQVQVKASPTAIEYWAEQYVRFVEVIHPKSLREKIKSDLLAGLKKYEE